MSQSECQTPNCVLFFSIDEFPNIQVKVEVLMNLSSNLLSYTSGIFRLLATFGQFGLVDNFNSLWLLLFGYFWILGFWDASRKF